MAGNSKAMDATYLETVGQEIATWENARRGHMARLGDFVLRPAGQWTARMIPGAVKSAATFAIEKTLLFSARAGALGIDQAAINTERTEKLRRMRALVPRLKVGDSLARKYWRNHCGYAAAQGAATGAAGLAGLVADLPLLISMALRSIRTIGLCYGYSTNTPEERNYILHVLRAGSSTEAVVRAESIAILKRIERSALDATAPNEEESTRMPYLMTIEQYAQSLALDLIRRNALQIVPFSSVVTSATFNAAYLNSIGRAAFQCYRRRCIGDFTKVASRRKKKA